MKIKKKKWDFIRVESDVHKAVKRLAKTRKWSSGEVIRQLLLMK